MKIAIVGAGLVGVTSAYYLSKVGHQIDVYDRETEVAMKCSKANGSQISVCNAETWHTWKNIKKGLKWMLSKDAPLLIRPTPTLPKLLWLAGFLRHSLNGSQQENTIRTIQLARKSSDLYNEIISEEKIEFNQLKRGIMHVYSDEKSMQDGFKSKKLFEDFGVEWKFMTPDEIVAYDDSMKGFKNLQGGFLTPSDWTGDAHVFCQQLKSICEKNGVNFIMNTEVAGVSGKKISYFLGERNVEENYDAVVLCNGHEISKWSILHGDFLNVYPVKGYSITIPNATSAPSVSLLDDDCKIVSSRLGDSFRVAGTAELAGENYEVRQDRIMPLINWTKKNFPDIDTSEYSAWACLRPMSSDMLPFIRKSKSNGLWYHGGHGHLGWTLSAATAKRLSDLMT